MRSKKIFFSIITPVLNNPDIENVFRCLNKQSYKNFTTLKDEKVNKSFQSLDKIIEGTFAKL